MGKLYWSGVTGDGARYHEEATEEWRLAGILVDAMKVGIRGFRVRVMFGACGVWRVVLRWSDMKPPDFESCDKSRKWYSWSVNEACADQTRGGIILERGVMGRFFSALRRGLGVWAYYTLLLWCWRADRWTRERMAKLRGELLKREGSDE